jgi:branched-subunit amino acid aminotransferase/4-amino-4-deoxychorismate lyase
MSFQLVDGAWVPCGSLPLDDRAFRYGMSVFETIAILCGQPLFFDAHAERLARASADSGMPVPVIPVPPVPARFDGVCRIYHTAGPGGPGDPLRGSVYALFEALEVGGSFPPARVTTIGFPFVGRPGGWKSGNYWQHVDALVAARCAGCCEGLLFNPSGALVSASMANVFLKIDGRWATPACDCGARDGVVREWVIGRVAVNSQVLGPEAVAGCSAAFLTNSRTGVRMIAEIDGRPLAPDDDGLQSRYCEEVLGS